MSGVRPILEKVTEGMLASMDKYGGNLLAASFLGPLKEYEQDNPPHAPEDINNGECLFWAKSALDALGGPSKDCRVVWIDNGEGITEYEFDHCVLFYKDKYYDAECMDGVEKPIDIPYFRDLNGREELLFMTFLPELKEVEGI